MVRCFTAFADVDIWCDFLADIGEEGWLRVEYPVDEFVGVHVYAPED